MSERMAAEPPPGETVDLAHPEYKGHQIIIVGNIFMALTTTAVVLRLYTRRCIMKSMGMDDVFAMLAWATVALFTVGSCLQTMFGVGIHIWNITFHKLQILLKIQVVVGNTYLLTVLFSKLSMCAFYLRLLPQPICRGIVWALLIGVSTYTSVDAIIVIFACRPIAASWDLNLAALPTTKCINKPALYITRAYLNISVDIILFLLPITAVWKLHLPRKQRIAVILIFASGLIACAVSIVRLRYIFILLESTDISWTTSDLLIWSLLEAHMSIICGCIPTLKPFFNKFFPRMLGSGPSSRPYPTNLSSYLSSGRSGQKLPAHNNDPDDGGHFVRSGAVDPISTQLQGFELQDTYKASVTVLKGGEGAVEAGAGAGPVGPIIGLGRVRSNSVETIGTQLGHIPRPQAVIVTRTVVVQ